jgi:uncharacterized FlaG/YvyC family protein
LKRKNEEIDELKKRLSELDRQLEENIEANKNKKLKDDKGMEEENEKKKKEEDQVKKMEKELEKTREDLKKNMGIIDYITSGRTELVEEDEVLFN